MTIIRLFINHIKMIVIIFLIGLLIYNHHCWKKIKKNYEENYVHFPHSYLLMEYEYDSLLRLSISENNKSQYIHVSSKYRLIDQKKLLESAFLMSQINNSAQAYCDLYTYCEDNNFIKIKKFDELNTIDSTYIYFAYYNASKALELGFDLQNRIREKIRIDSTHYYGSDYYLEKMKTKNNSPR